MILFFWILIQIIGESLPISSSGHVALMQKLASFFNVNFDLMPDMWIVDFLLHGPTILILFYYFFTVWWKLIFHRSVDLSMLFDLKVYRLLLRPLMFVVLADLMTFGCWMLDFAHYPWVQSYFLPIGFCCTAVCLIISSRFAQVKPVDWSLHDAIFLGTVQGLSLLPGISRFASTYTTGVWLGYGRAQAFAVSFLIQVPLLCAGFFKGLFAVSKMHMITYSSIHWWMVCVIILSSLVSYRIFCWVAILISQNRLWYFAYYMIVPIVLSIVF